jgi:hypothetical protein
MTHADVIAWWALVLAVAALVLHVPLSMIAHHYLPRIEDYLASRSKAKLTARICKLEAQLRESEEAGWSFSRSEWQLYDFCFGLGLLLTALANTLIALAMTVTIFSEILFDAVHGHSIIHNLPLKSKLVPVIGMTFVLLCELLGGAIYWRLSRMYRAARRHSDQGRESLRREIAYLSAQHTPD